MKSQAEAILAKYAQTEAAVAAARGARKAEAAAEQVAVREIRARVRLWKATSGYKESGAEGVLRLKLTPGAFDPASYKPRLRAKILAGRIVLSFEKKGVDGLAIYARLRGDGPMQKIGIDRNSPFYDDRPLAQAGVAETREYLARGMIGDEEIGLDSDIVSVTKS